MSDDFKLAPIPDMASDSLIHKLSELEEKQIAYQAKVIDQVTALMAPAKIPELFFNTKARHNYVYDRVPVGHDVGYRCYDGSKHDADSAFQSGEYGDGLSENEAYADLMKDEPPPIRTKDIPCGHEEPNDFVTVGSSNDWAEDDRE